MLDKVQGDHGAMVEARVTLVVGARLDAFRLDFRTNRLDELGIVARIVRRLRGAIHREAATGGLSRRDVEVVSIQRGMWRRYHHRFGLERSDAHPDLFARIDCRLYATLLAPADSRNNQRRMRHRECPYDCHVRLPSPKRLRNPNGT